MRGGAARGLLAVFFCALLATPWVIRRFRAPATTPPVVQETARSPYGFHMTEVSKAVGVDFVHQAPKLDPKLEHIMPQVASMGAAVSIVDFDRDGWQDVYVTNSGEGSLNRLYRNQGDGRFEDVAAALGVADLNRPETGVSMGAIWGDTDNDGYEDLFLYRWGRPELFRNEGGRAFTRVATASLPAWVNANSAVFFDYDADGRLDLFLGGYYPESLNLWKLEHTRMMPESFEYAKNGGRKYLFHNLGQGRFEEVSAKLGLTSNRWTLAAAAADLRDTGYPDLFIANDYGVSELFLNEGGKQFREAGAPTNVGRAPKSGMNAAFGDVLNQGQFAIYVSNISEEGVLIQGNNLWVPAAAKKGAELRYENLAREMGVELGGWSFGAQFGDLNNDGFQDLYLVNGYVSAAKGASYWYDFSKVAGGHRSIISDARNWPPMEGRSLSGYQQKRVWINDGAGRFQDVAQMVGVTDVFDGRSVALADLQNRGALDALVANQRGPLLVYRNEVSPAHRWIAFELTGCAGSGEPGCSNRSGIGAQVRVFWSGQQQVQEVSGGSGFCAQGQRRLHFGLGREGQVEKVVVRWPSGKTRELTGLATNTLHHLKEAE
jgi:enediyne biosynthesis protein E4